MYTYYIHIFSELFKRYIELGGKMKEKLSVCGSTIAQDMSNHRWEDGPAQFQKEKMRLNKKKDRWNNIKWNTNTQVNVCNTCLCSLVCHEWPGTQSCRNTGMFQSYSYTCHFCRDCHLMSTHLHLEKNHSYKLLLIQNAASLSKTAWTSEKEGER